MTVTGIAERARYLKLAALALSSGLRSGPFRSVFRGQGVEFDSVREYERGDDIRSIDWNVTARIGKPYVKLYREERELTILLVVDLSLSTAVSWQGNSVRSRIAETAALISFAALHLNSPVGAVLFGGRCGRLWKPRNGQEQVLSLLGAIERYDSRDRGTALEGALAGAGALLRRRSLICVISDFRVAGYEQNLSLLARTHDVIAVRINSPLDYQLPAAGYLAFRDPETRYSLRCHTSNPSFRRAWEQEYHDSLKQWEQICLRRGVHPVQMRTLDDPASVLQSFFARKTGGSRV